MRTSILDDPIVGHEKRAQLAELLADGKTRAEIAAVFGVNVDTITVWRKRPDIGQKVAKIIEDRANRILSHVDTRIIKRLESDQDGKIPLKDLLEIRRAFAPAGAVTPPTGDKAGATIELMKALAEDPELAEKFQTALAGATGNDDEPGSDA